MLHTVLIASFARLLRVFCGGYATPQGRPSVHHLEGFDAEPRILALSQNGPDEEPVEIDFTPPWPRISMCSALEKQLGVTFPTDLGTEEARLFFVDLVR